MKHRHDTAFTWDERFSIAASLLRNVSDDSEYWNELYEHAENAVRFATKQPELDPGLAAWCAAHGFDPAEYSSLAWDALMWVSKDRRSHDLLIRALASGDWSIAATAIAGLGEQHDEASLPLIERTIQRLPDNAASLASALSAFHSNAADTIAMRYLAEKRYETSGTLVERHRIARALLRRVDDDSVYWNELVPYAESIVDLVHTGLLADDYEQLAWSALYGVRADPRSRPLLIHALNDSPDPDVVYHAILGLGMQHDESSLPLVENAIQRCPRDNNAWALYTFHGGPADDIARRNLDDIGYEIYEMWRDEDCRKADQ